MSEGDNVVKFPPVDHTPESNEMDAVREKINKAMDDERLQQFASAIILGNQLYAWGVMFLMNEPGHDREILESVLSALHSSMIDVDGVPRPFTEEGMLANIEELLPFLGKEIKKHAKQRVAIAKLTDEMIAEAAKNAGQPKPTEEGSNNEK